MKEKDSIVVISSGNPDWGLLSKATEMAEVCDAKVESILFHRGQIDDAFRYGADQVYVLEHAMECVDDYAIAASLSSWMRQKHPITVLSSAEIRMRNIMPILAGMLDSGLTADCTELKMDTEGKLLQIRPAFGNNLLAEICTTGGIQMATVRPGIYLAQERNKEKKEVKDIVFNEAERVKLISMKETMEVSTLSQARVIIAGGMGIGSKKEFQILFDLAKMTGAAVGATRMAVDAGYAAYSCQVGQTGVIVHPQIYVAVGISGAIQHLAGMSSAQKIIAINKDAHAPIFNYADYGIIGDWKQIMPKLLEKMKEEKE